ncbi:hypothetical protein, partial [Parvibaculum sp.]|uniref:hypothetical protein n=1 Tax=Parvibaculum sp. TaxID=2024848 RepID=UPI002FD90BBD
IVPMLQCGLFRSNFSLAIGVSYLQLDRHAPSWVGAALNSFVPSGIGPVRRSLCFVPAFRPGRTPREADNGWSG